MRILFISERLLLDSTGAQQVAKTNLKSIIDIFGEENVDIISFSKEEEKNINKDNYKNFNVLSSNMNVVSKLANYLLFFNSGGMNKRNEDIIFDLIEKNKYDFVFLDSASYGKLAKKIYKLNKNTEIIVFLHDVNKYLLKSLIKSATSIKEKLKNYIFYPSYIYNEKKSIEFCDKLITLNKRDSELVKKEYKKNVNDDIPVSLVDRFERSKVIIENSKPVNILFVGVYYLPNIQGIKWFINNVLSHIDANLTIVGKGMEVLKEEITSDKVEILGFVDDLGKYYYESNFVIAPIFEGGGMKVKISEALMYGKTIFGTKEAFEGYDLNFGKIGEQCDSPKEFIDSINKYIQDGKINPFNEYSRNIFLEKYDYKVALDKMNKIINK